MSTPIQITDNLTADPEMQYLPSIARASAPGRPSPASR